MAFSMSWTTLSLNAIGFGVDVVLVTSPRRVKVKRLAESQLRKRKKKKNKICCKINLLTPVLFLSLYQEKKKKERKKQKLA